MTTDFLTDFLAGILQAEGVSNPVQVARKVALDLRKVRLVDHDRERVVSRGVRIYELRCAGIQPSVLAMRFGICVALVKREIAREMRRRRIA